MPTTRRGKQKILKSLFVKLSRPVFLTNFSIDIKLIFGHIPEALWTSTFTEAETVEFVEKQQSKLWHGFGKKNLGLKNELESLGVYPEVPTTLREIEEAKETEKGDERIEYFTRLFDP
jgi:hypothetical protein